MTNFSGVTRKGLWSWLTPERAVLVVPVLAGLGLSLLVMSAGVTPLSLRVREQEEVVKDLRYKSEMLPLLRQQLAELRSKQLARQQQLDRLLALVAGTSELNTFLTELDTLAAAHRVAITTTEPGPIERFIKPVAPAGQAAPPAAGGSGVAVSSQDPLLEEGLEKRSARLTVQGPFTQVLDFLRSLESLQVFVIISEMNVQAQTASDGETIVVPEVSLSLKLTAYGRQRSAQLRMEQN